MAQYSSKPQYFYNFTFQRVQENGGLVIGNCYLGMDDQNITLAIIDYACEQARMDPSSVLSSVNYLGFMSEAEFNAPLA